MEVMVDVDVDDIIDEVMDNVSSLSERERVKLLRGMQLDELRKIGKLKLTPRQVLYELRKFDIDLKGLRDEILEHFPLEPK